MNLCMEMSVIVFPVDVCQPEAEPDSGSVIVLNTAGLTIIYTSTFQVFFQFYIQHFKILLQNNTKKIIVLLLFTLL